MSFTLNTPVVFCVFSRLDTTKKVFAQIRKAQPPKLYIVCDAARKHVSGEAEKVEEVREYIESHVDWECEIKKNYAQNNMGCGRRISSGLTWVFEQEERAIILEDDCVPNETFFQYCQEMLEYYQDNDEVMLISGNNPIASCYQTEGDYTFSKVPFIWGWATWKHSWKVYDYNLKEWPDNRKNPIWKETLPRKAYWVYMAEFEALYQHKFDTWDYQLMYATIYHNKLNIVPSQSHVFNIGFQEESTHTKSAPKWLQQNIVPVEFPIKHQVSVSWNQEFDKFYMEKANKHGVIVKLKSILGIDVNRSIFEHVK